MGEMYTYKVIIDDLLMLLTGIFSRVLQQIHVGGTGL